MPRASKDVIPIFRSAFQSPEDENNTNLGVRPVVFDILAPDRETSILPDNLKMVLHVNPTSLNFSYEKVIERIQTKGGYVEQHWGDGPRSISFSMVTGGFMRLRTGLSNVTGGGFNTGGTRRETIAYDKYLDMLALFHNNGAIYDTNGSIAFHGIIKITFDGGIYFGWFSNFSVNENADKPYQFDLSADFTISHEVLRLRSYLTPTPNFVQPNFGNQGVRESAGGLVETPSSPQAPAMPKGGVVKEPAQVTSSKTVDPAATASKAAPTDPTFSNLELDAEGEGILDEYDPRVDNPPELFSDEDGVLDTYDPEPYDEGTTPGWDVPDLDTDGDGILDTYEEDPKSVEEILAEIERLRGQEAGSTDIATGTPGAA